MDASCGYARRILYCANSNIPALRLQQDPEFAYSDQGQGIAGKPKAKFHEFLD